jgi:hypothetical protein
MVAVVNANESRPVQTKTTYRYGSSNTLARLAHGQLLRPQRSVQTRSGIAAKIPCVTAARLALKAGAGRCCMLEVM